MFYWFLFCVDTRYLVKVVIETNVNTINEPNVNLINEPIFSRVYRSVNCVESLVKFT